jgi:hypothetical protein
MILSLSCEWINILSSTTMIWIFPLHNFIQYWYLLILFQMVIRLRISLPWLNFNLSESSVKSLLKTGCSKRNVESLIKFRRSEASEYGLWFVFTLKSKLDFHVFTYWIMIFHGSCCTRDHVFTSIFSVFHMSRFRKKGHSRITLRPLSDPLFVNGSGQNVHFL